MADLTTLDRVRVYLGSTSEANIALELAVSALISSVSAEIQSMAGRPLITEGQATVTFDGDGTSELWLPDAGPGALASPPFSISSVKVDGSVIPPRASTSGAGWVSDSFGRVRLAGSVFTEGVQNVEVTYSTGYPDLDSLPEDIIQAATMWTVLRLREKSSLGKSAESMAGMSVTFLPSLTPRVVEDVVARYRLLRC